MLEHCGDSGAGIGNFSELDYCKFASRLHANVITGLTHWPRVKSSWINFTDWFALLNLAGAEFGPERAVAT